MNTVKLMVTVLAAAIAAVACSQGSATSNNTASANVNKPAQSAPSPAPAATPDEAEMTAELYKTNCAACHKPDGKGGKVTIDGKTLDPDDITTARMAAKTDEKLTGYIRDGFPDDGMPAFKDKLSADQIKAIVAHVRKLQKS